MLSKEFRGAVRDVAVGESRLRGLLRPADPVPPSARLRSVPSPPGPPPSFGVPYPAEKARGWNHRDHRGTVARPEENGEPSGESAPYKGPPSPPAAGPAEARPRTMSGRADQRAPGQETLERTTSGRALRRADHEVPGQETLERMMSGRAHGGADHEVPDPEEPERTASGQAPYRVGRGMPVLEALERTSLSRTLARLDPGVPGLRVLVAIGLLAAVVTGIVVWRSRAVAEPVAPPIPAAGLESGPGARSAALSRPGTGPGAGPDPDRGPDRTKAGDPGASAYTPGTGGVGGPSSGPATRAVVYVTGRVRRPGVFVLPPGARVADAIEAAGGVRKGASPGGVNLARHVVDGEQITVGGPAPSGAAAGPGAPPEGAAMPGGVVVNLNTATAGQLDALPGVGGVIAQRIVDYRDARGGFQSVDQLKDVPGIGERKFAELRDKVTV
ncbi:ComEA family DNA-binding protein [Microbispora sp. H10885]|uniref:ComEA family DNA-binding protein n=1 Tax=Microbispora sp. H10885 TaxID=2729110 RepID=UPI001C718A53|nr:ComEA family DNA-binding protein [Microbispora sp. H10885]